jgi:hypothetical protein
MSERANDRVGLASGTIDRYYGPRAFFHGREHRVVGLFLAASGELHPTLAAARGGVRA